MGNCIIARNGGGMETYSTDEQVIGTWVDGRKVYRKVLTMKPNIYYELGDASIVINYYGWVPGIYNIPFALPLSDGKNGYFASISSNTSGHSIQLETTSNITQDATVVVEYIKI